MGDEALFGKVLIANRGEIVNRVLRALDQVGSRGVVVYSDADAEAPYRADHEIEKIHIGRSVPAASYLNIEALVAAVKASGAHAVHPGYGFLSESAAFARAVADAGAAWIGPVPQILEAIESKSYCRWLAASLGIPVAPGGLAPIGSAGDLPAALAEAGRPALLKLDKGGGGKGIEAIEADATEADALRVFESLSRIGRAAFGCGDVYAERRLAAARHVEVQFLADAAGNVVCLGERECSIQRRFQKVVEESPSQAVSPAERLELYQHTRNLARGIGYQGAGTVEFLKDAAGNFYFIEINARLQVEHPVSEMVTGVDIVAWQLRIAAGEPLDFRQEDVRMDGHAIECRVYAEDPVTRLPSPGTLTGLRLPRGGDQVRVEHALAAGGVISPYYDPLLCKVIVWAPGRDGAIDLMARALGETRIEGVRSTVAANLAVLSAPSFRAGNATTSFLEDAPPPGNVPLPQGAPPGLGAPAYSPTPPPPAAATRCLGAPFRRSNSP
jgi:acetyl/propionyl-CoA carboxylase alpha subunit